jgi:hypothetical protein
MVAKIRLHSFFRFAKNQAMSDLYRFVFAQPDTPDHFDITTTFPKKSFRCCPPELVLDEGEENRGCSAEAAVTFAEAGVQDCTAFLVIDLEA